MIVFQAPGADCLAAVQAVIGIVERRHTLPILANLLIRKTGARIEWTSSDLELQVRTSADLGGDTGDFSTTVAARKLADILRSLPPAQPVTATAQAGRLTLRSGGSRFTLHTLPAADFPLVQEAPDHGPAFTLPQALLQTLIEQVDFAMAVHDIRYYLNGLLFTVEGGTLTLVASDGNRLALAQAPVALDADLPRQSVILSRKTVQELLRLLRESPAPAPDEAGVRVRFSATQAHFQLGAVAFITKLVEGRFPDYRRVLPAGNRHLLTLDRASLQTGLQRASILTSEKFRGVRLTLSAGRVRVAASNAEHEEADVDVEAVYEGPRIEIGFNVGYLLDVLADTRVGTVQMALNDAHSSVLITCPVRPGFQYVVSPMRL